MWQRLGVGSLSESNAVFTSVSTYTSDLKSVVVVSNLSLIFLYPIRTGLFESE